VRPSRKTSLARLQVVAEHVVASAKAATRFANARPMKAAEKTYS
jgi:hypothetical protein